ncbi:MAG: hypothetical protein AAF206_28215 [Bacteroidota bacterium]
MRKKQAFFLTIFMLVSLFIPHLLNADTASVEPRLYINSTTSKAEYVEIIYEITMPGFVELHLFDKDDEKLWIKGKVTDRVGSDYIRIPKKPLKIGERYKIVLKYKGKDYDRSLWVD